MWPEFVLGMYVRARTAVLALNRKGNCQGFSGNYAPPLMSGESGRLLASDESGRTGL